MEELTTSNEFRNYYLASLSLIRARVDQELVKHSQKYRVPPIPEFKSLAAIPASAELSFQSVANSSQRLHQPTTKKRNDEPQYEQIQSAVRRAVTNYYDWNKWFHASKTEKAKMKSTLNISDENLIYRGKSGAFTWFRHGEKGKEKAQKLLNAVNKFSEYDDQNEATKVAIKEINLLLKHSKTRFETHSFASFLLDELKIIKNTPWHDLKYKDQDKDKERHYSKSEIKKKIKDYEAGAGILDTSVNAPKPNTGN